MAVTTLPDQGLRVPHLEGVLEDELSLHGQVLIETCGSETDQRQNLVPRLMTVNIVRIGDSYFKMHIHVHRTSPCTYVQTLGL